jgi:hypothetical protein
MDQDYLNNYEMLPKIKHNIIALFLDDGFTTHSSLGQTCSYKRNWGFMLHFYKEHSEQAIKVIGVTRDFCVPADSNFISIISSRILIK